MLYRRWYVAGKLCGYPDCCSLAFALGNKANERDNFYGTGYVPCSRCSNHAPSFLLDKISKNRDSRLLPFPNDYGLTNILDSWF